MQITTQAIFSDIQAIRELSPLIHNITNYVVMEQTANCLLAVGASPVMAHALEEASDMTKIASSLVLNMGTLSPSWVQAMKVSLQTANTLGIPIAFDPVGAGATPYRTRQASDILNQGSVTVIRGNASEIVTLNGAFALSRGVDSLLNTTDYQAQAEQLALSRNCVVWMSGTTDIITNGKVTIFIHNGHPLMSKVTGMGCSATAITGAFLAVNPDPLLACTHASVVMGVTGELAAKISKGPGSFKLAFIDALYPLSLNEIEEHIRYEISY